MKNHIINFVFFLMAMLIITSCANYKIHQANDTDQQSRVEVDTLSKLTHSIYLIGDVGENLKKDTHTALALLNKHLDQASENSTVLFLGNNVGSKGMPPKGKEKARQLAENRLDLIFNMLNDFGGQPIFLPGNNDWKEYGGKGIARQEKYIESTLNKHIEEEDDWGNYFLPDHGCPGSEVVEINDKLVIILIDSHWWLMNWDEEPNVNSDCHVKNRQSFALELASTIKDHKNKNIVFASHHPFKSSGQHGGKFSLKNHLFPFTTETNKAYIPLPGLGSIYLFLRQSGILKQDISNANYRALVKTSLDAAKGNGEYIFVSGHDHSLQYLQDDGQHFIVSGAGTSATPTAKKKGNTLQLWKRGIF